MTTLGEMALLLLVAIGAVVVGEMPRIWSHATSGVAKKWAELSSRQRRMLSGALASGIVASAVGAVWIAHHAEQGRREADNAIAEACVRDLILSPDVRPRKSPCTNFARLSLSGHVGLTESTAVHLLRTLCDRDDAQACDLLGFHISSPADAELLDLKWGFDREALRARGPQLAKTRDEGRLFTQKACDLGDAQVCVNLALDLSMDDVYPTNKKQTRIKELWERACKLDRDYCR